MGQKVLEQVLVQILCKECKNLDPYFEGFTGKIIKIDKNKFLIKGNYTITKNIVHITELPIGIWTQDYIDYLATLLDNKKKTDKKTNQINYISDFKDLSNDTLVDIQIHFYPNKIQELLSQTIDENTNGLEKLLKLYNFHTTTNMHLFDFNDKLKKYNSIQEIIEDYYIKRLELYNIRKTQQLDILKLELKILSNKAKFIQETLNDTIDLRKKKEEEINLLLSNKKYDKIDDKYDYLTKLPMDSVSSEKVSKLLKDKELKEKEVNILSNKSIENIWLEDLNHLKENYVKYKEYRIELQNGNNKDKITKSKLKLKLNK
jgi:DNA topoisomerase-2